MPIPISPKQKSDYILKRERGTDGATVFEIRPLTPSEVAEVQDSRFAYKYREGSNAELDSMMLLNGTRHLMLLRRGWVGVRKFAEWTEVDDMIAKLSPADRAEVAEAIWELCTPSGTEVD